MTTRRLAQLLLLGIPLLLTLPGISGTAEADAIYFVSPEGQDDWSGGLDAPNVDHTDGPFCTLGRARDAVRAHIAMIGLDVPLVVELREGKYFPSSSVKPTAARPGVR